MSAAKSVNGNQKLHEDLITNHKFAEQRETFKRIANLKKGGTDTSQPETYKLSKKLGQNRKSKANTYEHEMHLKHLANL